MAPVLYSTAPSPPGRAVWITAKAIGLELEHREVDLGKQEQLLPEYVKMNPQHTIPTLDDDGTIVWESHAIMSYLIAKYAKDDSFYPKDIKIRATIDQRMHFDTGCAFPLIRRILLPMLYRNEKSINEQLLQDLDNTYHFLEKFLGGNQWMCGNSVTIADFGLLATTTSLHSIIPVDATKYPGVIAWMKRAEDTLPYFRAVNDEGVKILKDMCVELIKKVNK